MARVFRWETMKKLATIRDEADRWVSSEAESLLNTWLDPQFEQEWYRILSVRNIVYRKILWSVTIVEIYYWTAILCQYFG